MFVSETANVEPITFPSQQQNLVKIGNEMRTNSKYIASSAPKTWPGRRNVEMGHMTLNTPASKRAENSLSYRSAEFLHTVVAPLYSTWR